MTEFVRVRYEDGSEASVPAGYAERKNLKPLDKPATRHGRALPATYPDDSTAKPAGASKPKEK